MSLFDCDPDSDSEKVYRAAGLSAETLVKGIADLSAGALGLSKGEGGKAHYNHLPKKIKHNMAFNEYFAYLTRIRSFGDFLIASVSLSQKKLSPPASLENTECTEELFLLNVAESR